MARLPEVYRGQPLATIFVSYLRQGAKLRWHVMGSLLMCVFMYVRVYVCTCLCMYVYVCTCLCMYVRVYVCTCLCMYVLCMYVFM